ncbi:MAG: hypothetical protein CFE28_08760 [Alphaproteobacteria bacterium PA2]|nr:MAG: hypothetical protein CFE28_08760 [Alphaproteobacteria bacterium PA2]
MSLAEPLPRQVRASVDEPQATDLPGQSIDRRGPMRPAVLEPSRRRLSGRLVTRMFQIGDILALCIGAALVHQAMPSLDLRLLTVIVAAASSPLMLAMAGAYNFSRRENIAIQAVVVCAAMGASLGAAALVLIFSGSSEAVPRAFQLWALFGALPVLGLHILWWALVRRWRATGRLTPNIIVVGATGAASRLINSLLQSRDAHVLGLFDDRAARSPSTVEGVPVLGGTRDLMNHRIMPYVDRLVISVPSKARQRVRELIERLQVLPNEIVLLLDKDEDGRESDAISRIADVPLAHISGPPSNEVRALFKRIQDVVIGALALVLTFPIMLATMVAIKLDSPGPIFFRQRRHGFNNEEILVWKFRSMRVEMTDAKAHQQVRAGDARVTRVGRFIRKTSIDELPQIFNVLAGQMSLVGPRPHAIGMKTGDVESARLVAEYAHRHQMKPGMTGWAAIKGSRGPVDTPELVERRVALDIEYIQRQSFWLDLWIMFITVPVLIGDTKAIR